MTKRNACFQKIVDCETKFISITPLLVILLMIVNVSAGAFFGYNIGIIGVSLKPLIHDFPDLLNNSTLGATNQALFGGMYFGGLVFGPILAPLVVYLIGYKFSLICSSFLGATAQLFCIFSVHYYMLIVGRFLLGLVAGISTITATEYGTTMCPPHRRGLVGTMFLVGLTSNLLLANIANFLTIAPYSWRLQLTVALIPSFILFFVSLIIPESPKWREGKVEKKSQLSIPQQLRELCIRPKNWWKMFLFFVMILSFLCGGVIPFINYLPYTLDVAGITDFYPRVGASIAISFGNLVTALMTSFVINLVGRKVLLGIGYIFMFISTLTCGLVVHFVPQPTSGYVVMCLAVLFLIGNNGGVNSLIYFFPNELFDRDIALVSAGVMFTLFNIVEVVVAQVYLPMLNAIKLQGMFWFYSCMTAICGLFLMFFLPETRVKKSKTEKPETSGITVDPKTDLDPTPPRSAKNSLDGLLEGEDPRGFF